jgi:ATP-dependent RNA helicase RhlE
MDAGDNRSNIVMSFANLGLRTDLLRAVEAQGYTIPTPIQTRAIPMVLAGRDILAGARTGTGKTAAFALPILQRLSESTIKMHQPRVLVLTPTRELAAQVGQSFETYGRYLSLRTTVIFGGVSIGPQKSILRNGVDILVATPGRLLDHAGQKTVDLSKIEVLVLDEADRMLDMGFINDIRKVLKLLPQKRQNMLFSATYTEEIKRLADGLLKNPVPIEVSERNTAAEGVSQLVYPVAQTGKRQLLSNLVFTRTKHRANQLTKQLLSDGVKAAAIHGNKSQSVRTQALADFKKGTVQTLVATDIAARGLDIAQLPHVVNFDLPHVPEDYIHRIGRTGRAGFSGVAHSLVSPEEQKLLMGIQRLLNHRIPVKKHRLAMG